jgi:hypothetical protein
MAVLGKRRMVGNLVLQAKAAKPAVGQIEGHLLAQLALRSNPLAVTHQQHPDHQLRIDRGAAGVAVKRRQLAVEIPEIEDDVNLPEEVVAWNPIVEAEFVEELGLITRQSTHHRGIPRSFHDVRESQDADHGHGFSTASAICGQDRASTTTPSARTALWDTGHQHQKRSPCQAGPPAPLRVASAPAWHQEVP